MSENLAIRCRGLVKRYEEVVAVDGLDLEVLRGECFGLLGPNGAGKTSTLEVLEGLIAPTAGEVEVLGRSWGRHERELRERLGITLQETRLPEKLTVLEIVELFRSFYERGRAVEEIIALVALEEKRRVWYEKLSGGQKQRLAVACALVGDPQLLFLDEPTTGLDPQSRRQLWDVVLGLKAEGRTVLLTTHYMDEAERLCDRVAIVDRGRVIALGTPRELIARVAGHAVVEFAVDGALLDEAALGALPGARGLRRTPGGFALTVDRVHVAVPALLAHLEASRAPLERLSTHSATLEDVFVTLTGRRLRE
ncbi:MAG TPA: ABC transporter ATP-binding protein [Anaeromyxobacteraceae bacterium]|nr:ABC transporter ATP-binding protein [Anaeromyxobacteraceae bacterium]